MPKKYFFLNFFKKIFFYLDKNANFLNLHNFFKIIPIYYWLKIFRTKICSFFIDIIFIHPIAIVVIKTANIYTMTYFCLEIVYFDIINLTVILDIPYHKQYFCFSLTKETNWNCNIFLPSWSSKKRSFFRAASWNEIEIETETEIEIKIEINVVLWCWGGRGDLKPSILGIANRPNNPSHY